MPRETLLDFFADLSRTSGTFLVHDDGFRVRSWTYAEVAAAAEAFARTLAAARHRPRRQGRHLGREPAGVDRRLLGHGAARRDRRADRLPRLARLPRQGARASSRPGWCSSATKSSCRPGTVDAASRCGGSRGLGPRAPPPRRTRRRRRSRRRASRARRSSRSSSPPAPPPSRRAWSSPTGTSSPTSCRSSTRCGSTAATRARSCRCASSTCCRSATCSGRRWRPSCRRCCPAKCLHAQLQPARHRPADQVAAHLGAGLGAEDPRRAARPRRARVPATPRCRDPGPMHWSKRWWTYREVHRAFGWKFWAAVVGAAPLDPGLEEYWGRLGFLVMQGYGLTETAPIVTLNHPLKTRRGSVGKPIAGVEVKIADDGEILVRGDNVTKGYYGAPEATARGLRGRLAAHRRHRRHRRAGPHLHPGPQEGDDRHARGAERLPRGRRARADRDRRACATPRWSAAPGAARSACTRCSSLDAGVDARRDRARRPTRRSAITRRSAAPRVWPAPSCRAPTARAS